MEWMSEVYQVLGEDGGLLNGGKPFMEGPRALEGLRWMMFSRAYDIRATGLQRQGRLGTFSPVKGQEASVIGTSMALDPKRDWIVPSYRESPAQVRHGMPLDRLLASYMGKLQSGRIPDGVNILPNQVALATQLLQAAGLAWGLRLQKKDGVVMVYCGEGATSEGDFHEACNLAGVMRAPIVFVVMNNQWAISTSRDQQTAAEQISHRARGYGFPGVTVDGNDLLATYEKAQAAVDRARAGDGPTLIETITYRLSFHNTTDNPKKYLPEGWLEEAEKKDPIPRLQAYLAAQGLWDEGTRAAIESEITEQIDGAVESAASMPISRPSDIFDNVYQRPPGRQLKQRAELLGPEA